MSVLNRHIARTLVLLALYDLVNSSDTLKVKTNEGFVVGKKASDGNYTTFLGVPYAGTVSKQNRFKDAPALTSYDELIADRKILCAQPGPRGLIGTEDCLTVNIYTNDVTVAKPVLVWIHGEDYSSTYNTDSYSYKTYVKSGLVVVNVNYRLSIFGFLCLGVQEAPGNAGIKDVMKALNWIKDNILSFGGDPKNITLIGHGTGAAIVDILTLSPQTENLIHRAIVISGSALSPWAIAYSPVEYAKLIGSKIRPGSEIDNNSKLAKLLQEETPNKLIEKIHETGIKFRNQSLLFAPCIENSDLKGAFLKQAPLSVLKSGKYNHIPYIAGYVREEGTMRVNEALKNDWLKSMQKDFAQFMPVDMAFENADVQHQVSISRRKSYFEDKEIKLDTINEFFDYEGEILIQSPILKSVRERARLSKKPVRLFAFVFREDLSKHNKWSYPNISLNGIPHGRILDYILDEETPTVLESHKAFLVKRIIAFAKTGIPITEFGDDPGDVAWRQVTAQDLNYLKISGPNPNSRLQDPNEFLVSEPITLMTWDEFYGSYYRYPKSISSSANLTASASFIIMSLFLIISNAP